MVGHIPSNMELNGVGMTSGVIPAEVAGMSLGLSVLCTDRGIPSLLHNPSAVSNACSCTYDEEVIQVMQHWLYPMLLQYPLHSYCIKDFGGQCKSFPSSACPGVACRWCALVCTFSPIEEQILQSLKLTE